MKFPKLKDENTGQTHEEKNPYLLKALLISEQLEVLMKFQTMLLKEAIKGRLHVSELSKKPTKQRYCLFPLCGAQKSI